MSQKTSILSARRQKMDRALPSAKSFAFPVGSIIHILSLQPAEYKDGAGEMIPNDKFVVKVEQPDGAKIDCTFPVRELLKGKCADENTTLFTEEGKNTHFHPSYTITAAEDRKDRNDNEVYPVQAYNAFESQLEAGAGIDWNALVASGVKDNNTLSPVQNYTFSVGA